MYTYVWASQVALVVNRTLLPTANAGDKRHGFDPGLGRSPTPGFLPGEPHGQRNLVVYSA